MIAACPKSCVVERTFFESESPPLPNVVEGWPGLKVDRLSTGGGCRGKERLRRVVEVKALAMLGSVSLLLMSGKHNWRYLSRSSYKELCSLSMLP